MKDRTLVITDWRVRDEDDLPDVSPGEEHEHVITPQKHVVLRRILVHDLTLVRVEIGPITVPFRRAGTDGSRHAHDPHLTRRTIADLERVSTARQLREDEIALLAGQDVRLHLRNDTDLPIKLRASLLAREEI